MRLAIITTHPIQYYAPVFKLLNERQKIAIKVFYTWGEKVANKYDPGFDQNIEWDIPLLEDYPYEWVVNTAPDPGTHHFKGIINPGIIDQINAWDPQAVLGIGWGFDSHLKVLRYYKKRLPVFFRGDSTLLDEQKGWKAAFRAIFLKWVYRHVDHAFYVGLNNKAYFKKHGLKDSQLSFAPHAVDNQRFAGNKLPEVITLRKKLKIDTEATVVLFAGKMEEKKAPLQLLEAFMALGHDEVHLLFVGNGPQEQELKEKAAGKANIHFLGFQNQTQMPVVYQACDLFCLPSTGPGETWGLAVNEAMACGKAVLLSDKAGCAADLVIEGFNGYTFKAGDIADMTDKLKQLAPDITRLIRYGERSRIMIKDWNFTNIAIAIETKLLNEKN